MIKTNENRFKGKKSFNFSNEENSKFINTKTNNNNESVKYFKYLVSSLLIIFILSFSFIFCNNFYYNNYSSNKSVQLNKSKSNKFQINNKQDNINKEGLPAQKLELIETLNNNK